MLKRAEVGGKPLAARNIVGIYADRGANALVKGGGVTAQTEIVAGCGDKARIAAAAARHGESAVPCPVEVVVVP